MLIAGILTSLILGVVGFSVGLAFARDQFDHNAAAANAVAEKNKP